MTGGSCGMTGGTLAFNGTLQQFDLFFEFHDPGGQHAILAVEVGARLDLVLTDLGTGCRRGRRQLQDPHRTRRWRRRGHPGRLGTHRGRQPRRNRDRDRHWRRRRLRWRRWCRLRIMAQPQGHRAHFALAAFAEREEQVHIIALDRLDRGDVQKLAAVAPHHRHGQVRQHRMHAHIGAAPHIGVGQPYLHADAGLGQRGQFHIGHQRLPDVRAHLGLAQLGRVGVGKRDRQQQREHQGSAGPDQPGDSRMVHIW